MCHARKKDEVSDRRKSLEEDMEALLSEDAGDELEFYQQGGIGINFTFYESKKEIIMDVIGSKNYAFN